MSPKLHKVCFISNMHIYEYYIIYSFPIHHRTGPYTNVLYLYLFPSMSHRHSAHLQRQSNKEPPLDKIWKTVEDVWNDTVSAEVARSCLSIP